MKFNKNISIYIKFIKNYRKSLILMNVYMKNSLVDM